MRLDVNGIVHELAWPTARTCPTCCATTSA